MKADPATPITMARASPCIFEDGQPGVALELRESPGSPLLRLTLSTPAAAAEFLTVILAAANFSWPAEFPKPATAHFQRGPAH